MDCIDLFKRAAMALQTDPRYLVLDQARKANDKDEELQNMIGEFNLARMDLNNEIGRASATMPALQSSMRKSTTCTARSWPMRGWWLTMRPSVIAKTSSTTSTRSSTLP